MRIPHPSSEWHVDEPSLSAAAPGPLFISLSPKRVLKALLTVIFVLSALSFVGQLLQHFAGNFTGRDFYINITNVDREQTVPTLFSTVQIAASAGIVALIAWSERRSASATWKKWVALSVVMVYLTGDESLSLHERLNDPFRDALDATGSLYYAWVIPGAVAAVVVASYFLPFVLSLPSKVRSLMLLSGAMYVAGAIGFELLGTAVRVNAAGFPFDNSTINPPFAYVPLAAAEEGLEMTAIAVFIFACLLYLRSTGREIFLQPEPPESPDLKLV